MVDHMGNRVADLPQVMRQQIAGHSHRNPRRSIHQQIRKFAGEHLRFLKPLVVIRLKINRVQLQIRQQFALHFGRPRLGVTHGRRGIPVGRAEIALPVDQGIAQAPFLRQAHEGWIDDRFTVRVIIARRIAGDFCTLEMFGARAQPQIIHSHQDPPLRGLEPIADIGQGPVHDGAHGVGEIAVLELLLDLKVFDPIDRSGGRFF